MSKYPVYLNDLDLLIIKKLINFLYKNRIRTYLVIAIFLFGIIVLKIPYVNIFFTSSLLWPVIIITALYIYKVNVRNIALFCLFLLIILPLFVILHLDSQYEFIGNIIYFLLWLALIKLLKRFKDKNN